MMFTEEEYEAVGAVQAFLRWCYEPLCKACGDTGSVGRITGSGMIGYQLLPCWGCRRSASPLLNRLAELVVAQPENEEDINEWARRLGAEVPLAQTPGLSREQVEHALRQWRHESEQMGGALAGVFGLSGELAAVRFSDDVASIDNRIIEAFARLQRDETPEPSDPEPFI